MATRLQQGGLVSIGYEGRSVGELIATLVEQGVTTLADVRLTPISRKPGLSKKRLAQALEAAGIDYLHFPMLGNPKNNREPFQKGRVDDGRAHFLRLLESPGRAESLEELLDKARHSRVALLCYERDHDRCHRQVVTEELARRDPTLGMVARL